VVDKEETGYIFSEYCCFVYEFRLHHLLYCSQLQSTVSITDHLESYETQFHLTLKPKSKPSQKCWAPSRLLGIKRGWLRALTLQMKLGCPSKM
jgi:hypothetical protein